MTHFHYPLLTDENIHPQVVTYLRDAGFDVLDVKEQGWQGMSDEDILTRAYNDGRIVISHDRDFGTLAIAAQKPITGILYVRPAEIQVEKTIRALSRFLAKDIVLQPPFIVVIQGTKVRIRTLEESIDEGKSI